jgi:hypothetical protein
LAPHSDLEASNTAGKIVLARLQRRNAELTFARHKVSDQEFDDWPAQMRVGD